MAEALEEKVFRASHRFARIAPRKVRLVADAIRGKNINEALRILKFLPTRSARFMEKVLESVKANASLDEKVNEDNLRIIRAYVDGGPIIKRWQAHARGRAVRIRRRLCHINVAAKEFPEEKDQIEDAAMRTGKSKNKGKQE